MARRRAPPDASSAPSTIPSPTRPPEEVGAWLEAALGEAPLAWTPLASPLATRGAARVHRIDGPRGPRAVLKRHADVAKHRREVATYRAVAAVPALAARTPALLAATERPEPRLLMQVAPGTAAPPPPTAPPAAVLADVGAYLAALHATPVAGTDPLPVGEAMLRRADAALASLPPHRRAEAERTRAAVAAAAPSLAGRERRLAHRDVGPHNWRLDGGRLAAVLDFEHARADLPEVDLARLLVTYAAAPDAVRAVLAAYAAAGGPAPLDAGVLFAVACLDAAAAAAWAARRTGPAARAAAAQAEGAWAALRHPGDVALP